MAAAETTIEATAQGIASVLCAHGPEVEWRICTIWEAAYGLIPLSSSSVDLPEIIVATPLQPPILSWNLYIPLLKVLEYLPRGSPSETCLMKIFVATVEAILQKTFPPEISREQIRKTRYAFGSATKNLAVAELRTMIHSLFVMSCASEELASRLLFIVLTVCISHESQPNSSKRLKGEDSYTEIRANEESRDLGGKQGTSHGPVAAFDSYVMAAMCALSCELQIFPFITQRSGQLGARKVSAPFSELQKGVESAVTHTRQMLAILEALFSLKPSSIGTSWGSNEVVAAAVVAAHISDLFRRSKACMQALSVLIRCKWDKEIKSRASSLLKLINNHSKVVESIVNKAEPLEAHLLHASLSRKRSCVNCCQSESGRPSSSTCGNNNFLAGSGEVARCTMGKEGASFSVDATDLANFLTMDRHTDFNSSVQVLLRPVLAEKQELCFSAVSVLWHKLIASPETQPSAESTSAQQGWRQVVDALCNVVSASPAKAATAVVLQV